MWVGVGGGGGYMLESVYEIVLVDFMQESHPCASCCWSLHPGWKAGPPPLVPPAGCWCFSLSYHCQTPPPVRFITRAELVTSSDVLSTFSPGQSDAAGLH